MNLRADCGWAAGHRGRQEEMGSGNALPGPGGYATCQHRFHTKILSRSALGAGGTFFHHGPSPLPLVPW